MLLASQAIRSSRHPEILRSYQMHFARPALLTAPKLKFCLGMAAIILLNTRTFAQEIQKGQLIHNQQELRVKAQELLESDSVVG